MPRKINIVSAGNVLVPAYLALLQKGYRVTRKPVRRSDDCESWHASKAGNRFMAEDPLSLLGIVALYETRGACWKASDDEIDRFS